MTLAMSGAGSNHQRGLWGCSPSAGAASTICSGYGSPGDATQRLSSSIPARPSKLTRSINPLRLATASNRRPTLEVNLVPIFRSRIFSVNASSDLVVAAIAGKSSQSNALAPNVVQSNASAARRGSRAAASPPSSGYGFIAAIRWKPLQSPSKNSRPKWCRLGQDRCRPR